jgi:hypothetical protein
MIRDVMMWRSTRIPGPDFFPSRIPDPGIKKASDPGSANTVFHITLLFAEIFAQ